MISVCTEDNGKNVEITIFFIAVPGQRWSLYGGTRSHLHQRYMYNYDVCLFCKRNL